MKSLRILNKPAKPVREHKPIESVFAAQTGDETLRGAARYRNLYFFVAIVNDGQGQAIARILNKRQAAASFLTHASGTATNDFYHVLGFDESHKQVVFALTQERQWGGLKNDLRDRFSVSDFSRGIAFVSHVDSLIGLSAYKMMANVRPLGLDKGDIPMEETKKSDDYEMVVAIVNDGYVDLAMDAAKKAGARGGTVLTARGTGNEDIEKFFGLIITPEKQIAIILVPRAIKDAVLRAIYRECGINTKGQGIAFSMPVSDVVGLVSAEGEERPPMGKKAEN
ncbi:MAG: P-II family nitrogen regulator [Bacilli bacterium]|nr:P-II family nitrogen regulator [Bacilli bacterium]